MKVSDYIVAFLEAQGIEYVFGYQGGMVTHMVDSLSKSKKLKFVSCYHEQNAAFAAEAYARMSGKFGVCLVTSGPGATNTLTSVGNAYFDSVPVLYITGQVNTYEYKYGKKIRQLGFQETDIVAIAKPITKDAFLSDDSSRIEEYMVRAITGMMTGRKGPVVMDLPMDVQRAETESTPFVVKWNCEPADCNDDDLREIGSLLRNSLRPIVICGGGCADPETNGQVRRFLQKIQLPYVVSLMGKGLVDETAPNCLGMIGSYGNRSANMALAEADVALVLGSRLDLRQVGNRKSSVLEGIKFIRVDIDRHEFEDNPLPNQYCCHASLEALLPLLKNMDLVCPEEWKQRLSAISSTYTQNEDVARHVENKAPYLVMDKIRTVAARDAIFVADIGQNQMWAAQMIRCGEHQRFLTSGGMAPMGYAISAAVGAAFATHCQRQIVCVCGDGGFHIGVQALMLISQYNLPITVVVLNNHALGMMTQFQSLYFNSNFAGTTLEGGYAVPDIKSLAAAYGLSYGEGLSPASIWEVHIQGLTTVVPKLEYNRNLNSMTPEF